MLTVPGLNIMATYGLIVINLVLTLALNYLVFPIYSKLVLPKAGMTSSRVFIRHRRLENSPPTTQNLPAKFCLCPERALPFHDNPPFTLQYSPATRILNRNLEKEIVAVIFVKPKEKP